MVGRTTRLLLAAALAAPFALFAHAGARAGPDTTAPSREGERKKLKEEIERDARAIEVFSRSFRNVAALVRPSVVHVEARRRLALPSPPDSSDDDWLRRFGEEVWKRFHPPAPRNSPDGFQVSTASGLVLDERGRVLTNDHVVRGDDAEITVKLHDDRVFKARVKGRDARTDLALLEIVSPPRDLEPAALGDSDAVSVGDWVLAIGNPFGLDQTVTAGIVSAKGRAHVGIAELEDFLQTDAPINPGSSGGPLVDLRGEVIGINTAIASHTGGYQGVGFSIPIAMAREIARSLEERGKVVRGWLGVVVQELTPDLAARFGTGERAGVLVSDALEGGPAAKAGIRPGDVILSFDSKPTTDPVRLRRLVAGSPVGKSFGVSVWRDGAARTFSVELGEMPGTLAPPLPKAEPRPSEGRRALGIEALDLTPALARAHGWREDRRGVLITGVEAGSLAALARVEAGSLIAEIDRKPIATVKDLDEALSRTDLARGVLLLLRTPDGASRFVVLRKDAS